MTDLPRDNWPDSTVPLLRSPYEYIPDSARQLGSDVFGMRLAGRQAYGMTGRAAAELFYDPRMTRGGAVPGVIRSVLFGPDGVIQGTDGAEHLHRKRQMMEMVERGMVADLGNRLRSGLESARPGWIAAGEIELFAAMTRVVTIAVCGWAGVPLPQDEAGAKGRMLAAMFLHAGAASPVEALRGLRARRQAQAWIEGLMAEIRDGRTTLPKDAPVARAARWTHADGTPLALDVAAADFLSFLRPNVANAVWITHLAHALGTHAGVAGDMTDSGARTMFVREVRRLYPFFPILAAVVGEGMEWQGAKLEPGARAILSLYGTNRDPQVWDAPDTFRPDRHAGREPGPFDMIPQGGGDYFGTHRCAGEWVSIRQMEVAAEWLGTRLRWRLSDPEARPSVRTPPGLPGDGLRLTGLAAR
ncbi:Fatty-acid peroxygenase [Jannaschia seosinensis]|uniref:Fatty-acid peroxygenase n=1 Tax=Jannaschia seosinensis TaxID=313367 RepID=A0A0M7BDC8_9RHOB|nr:cytochrome P450 [Jannaschia seosinensis]CUH40740.1 Fatty-acid peroxygenase [Jannaschia seosinensis]